MEFPDQCHILALRLLLTESYTKFKSVDVVAVVSLTFNFIPCIPFGMSLEIKEARFGSIIVTHRGLFKEGIKTE